MNTTGPEMDCPVQTRDCDESPDAFPVQPSCPACSDGATLPAVLLPLRTHSTSLLTLLFQDGAVDLELANSVVALDPGLAFATLQLANRDRCGENIPIWHFPLALVAAGHDLMLRLVSRAPRLESSFEPRRQAQLWRLYSDAVLRACIAQQLARKLGNCDASKAFLVGLLLELRGMIHVALPGQPIPALALLSLIRRTLPAAAATAVVASPYKPDLCDPPTPLAAIAAIADSLVEALARRSSRTGLPQKLALGPAWGFWDEIEVSRRSSLLRPCFELAKWVSANLYRMHPWEFVSRLESHKSWE